MERFLNDFHVEQLELQTWQDLLSWSQPPLQMGSGEFSHTAVQDALDSQGVPGGLADALETIGDLTSEELRDELIEVASRQRLVVPPSIIQRGPGDVAAWVFLQANGATANTTAASRTLDRIRLLAEQRAKQRTRQDFAGPQSRKVEEVQRQGLCQRLVQLLKPLLVELSMGESIETRSFAVDDVSYFRVLYGGRKAKPVEHADDGRRRALPHRPAVVDRIVYDSRTGLLSIRCRTERFVNLYRTLFGEYLFGNDAFFDGNGRYSLEPIAAGCALRPEGVPEVGDARLKECAWLTPGGLVVRAVGDDPIGNASRAGLNLGECRLLEVRLGVRIMVPRPKNLSVVVKAPNRMSVSSTGSERIVDRYLERLGLCGTQADAASTLWTVQGLTQPKPTWEAVSGMEFDKLVIEKLLIPARLPTVEGDNGGTGLWMSTHALEDGSIIGIPATSESKIHDLTPTHVEGWTLDLTAFCTRVAQSLNTGTEPVVGRDAAYLGRRAWNGHLADFYFAFRMPTDIDDFEKRIRGWRTDGTPVLVLPTGCALRSSIATVTLADLNGDFGRVLPDAVGALKWNTFVPLRDRVQPTTRLALDLPRGEISLDGVPLAVKPESHPFRLLVMLADGGGRVVSKDNINKLLSPHRNDDEAAKAAVRDAREAIRRALQQVPPSVGRNYDVIVNRAPGYLLGVAFERELA